MLQIRHILDPHRTYKNVTFAPIGYHRRFSHDFYDHNRGLSFPEIVAAVESLFIQLFVHLRVR